MGIEKFAPFITEMPVGWEIRKFNDVLVEPVRNGIYKSKEFHGRGEKLINMGEMFSYDFISGQEMRRLELNEKERKNFLVQDGDLLFARRYLVLEGSGKCSLVVHPPENTSFESSIIRARPNRKVSDPKFLFYLFKSPLGRAIVISIATRTAVSGIRGSDLSQLEIPLPPLPTQRRIAEILSAYDDLLEVNTRRIHILEGMAQSVYREWFGKVEAESMPEGWKTVKVGDVCNVGRGSSPRPIVDQRYFEGGNIPWIKIADATKSGKYLYETKEHVNEYGASFSRLLPKGSLILAASGTLGYTQILGVDGCIHDGWLYINEFNGVERDYLYYLFRSKQVFFNNSAYGAAIQNINTMILREMEIVLPPLELQTKFSKFISAIDGLLLNIDRKNANLRQTRDLLLPRLVGGEVSV